MRMKWKSTTVIGTCSTKTCVIGCEQVLNFIEQVFYVVTTIALPLCFICLEYLLPVVRTRLCSSLLRIIDLNGILVGSRVLVTAQTAEQLPIQLKRRTMCLTKQHHHSAVVLRCRPQSLPAHQLHRLFKRAPTYQRLVFLYLHFFYCNSTFDSD